MKQLNICIYLAALAALIPTRSDAQVLDPSDDGIVRKSNMHHNQDKEPVEYAYLHEDDILWSERHWERIQVKEKINLPLFYPLKPIPDRMSLWDVLIDGAMNEEYSSMPRVYDDEYFTTQLGEDELKSIIADTTQYWEFGILTEIDTIYIRSGDIVSYQIKSDWYFDKKRGELKNRIIGIAPEIKNEDGQATPIFWFWFPDARKPMANSVAFNEKNFKQRLTFDEIMHLRKFSSTIIKVDNVYGRTIEEYNRNRSMNQLLEAARLKEDLRNKEHDMWTY